MLDNSKPFIHTFKTYGGYYLYDVNRNSILEISQDTYELLNDMTVNSTMENDEIKLLKRNNFLSSKRIKEIVHPDDEVLSEYLDRKLRMITLQVTQQCNLRCSYCIYSGNYYNRSHSNRRMSEELAKKAINFLIEHSKDVKTINIAFYGGEPLLELELIKKCISYAEEKAEGKNLTFSITTNGTLVSDEIIEYFQKYDINLLISLDGPKDVHDRNRIFASNGRGSFEKIFENLERIRLKYPAFYRKISFNTVLADKNDFGCINNFYTKFDTVKNAQLLISTVTENYRKTDIAENINNSSYEEYEYEKFKFLLWKLGRLEKENISPVIDTEADTDLRSLDEMLVPTEEVPDKAHHGGPCIPGVQRLFVNVDGLFYPCERVSEESEMMIIGNIESGFDINKIRNLLNVGKLTEESCKNCWAFRFCQLCAASADNLTDLSGKTKSFHCSRMKNRAEELLKFYCDMKKFGYDYRTEKVFREA